MAFDTGGGGGLNASINVTPMIDVLLVLLIVFFDRLVPQMLFVRTEGMWVVRIRWVLQALFYLILPITLTLGLLLSIMALAEPEDAAEEEHPSEAMDALLEAGEEEGILEESDRELVRSVVEFGDKVRARAVTAGGESGHPDSRHFDDEAERYAGGNLREVYFYRDQLKSHTAREYHPGS